MRSIGKTSMFLVLIFVMTFPYLSSAAWPIFEVPPADPKADQLTVYSSDMSIRGYIKYFYDDNRNLLTKIEYDDPGNDDIWFTGDDTVDDLDVYTYNSNNNRILEIEYDSAGPDGKPLTADDSIEDYSDGYVHLNFRPLSKKNILDRDLMGNGSPLMIYDIVKVIILMIKI